MAIRPQGEPIPTWLEVPANATLPVVTKVQFLPFGDLTWENYERLCLRYIRLQGYVEFCQQYGVKGQDQEGIDFYARLSQPNRYAVYQCKRIRSLEPSDITNAVTTFLDGGWSDSSQLFVLCTSQSTDDTKFKNVIETQTRRLKQKGIELEILDRDRLSEELKSQAELVDDFFGRPWVEAFCGSDAVTGLGKRLDAGKVIEYRSKLAEFYGYLFNRHDPGIPVRPQIGSPDIDIVDRFVLPDVYSKLAPTSPEFESATEPKPSENINPETGSVERQASSVTKSGRNLRNRLSVDTWLSQADRSVILGGPGSGKSALLRFLALDLLSSSPSLGRLAVRWGYRLPVWVPFPFWTNLYSKGSGVSFQECLRSWFKHFDQDKAWLLVEEALNDQRLLLLVDGLDEWKSEIAARTASDLLQSYIHDRNVAAVLVSRPYGFQRTNVHGDEWQIAELAPLLLEQQQRLTLKWLTIRYQRVAGDANPEAITHKAEKDRQEFVRSLTKSPDLSQLAEIPLLLLLLLYLHLENIPLPDSRFEAYDHVITHFVKEHPLGKRTAASLTDDVSSLEPEEIRNAMAFIAAQVQERFPAEIFADSDIRPLLESFLKDENLGLGLPTHDARNVLKYFTNLEEGSLGLLVSQGKDNLSFFHRSLQEFLASVHLGRLPLASQQSIVRDRLPDPRWHEVILGMIWLCERNDDAEKLTQVIEQMVPDPVNESAKIELLAELAFGDFHLGPTRARELARTVCDDLERSTQSVSTARILSHVIVGLRSNKTRTIAQQRLRRWIFSRGFWSSGAVSALRLWPSSEGTWSVLYRTLHNEESSVQRAAGEVIAHVFKDDSSKADTIADMALRSKDVGQRAAALNCLVAAWPNHPLLSGALDSARVGRSSELRLISISARVRLGIHNQEDFSELLRLSRDAYGIDIDYAWWDQRTNTLVNGWRGDSRLKTICLESAQIGPRMKEGLDRHLARSVLVQAFPQDADVAEMIAHELLRDYPFNGETDLWQLMPVYFQNNIAVVEALDKWAAKLIASQSIHPVELSYAALVGKTDTMKQKLLESLEGWVPFWAVGALLEGWGMSDAVVSDHLSSMTYKQKAFDIAQYIPSILPDPKKARDRLLSLMRDQSSTRLDFIVDGFGRLSEKGDEEEILDACLDRLSTAESFDDIFKSSLIRTFRSHKRIRDLSLSELQARQPMLGAIAEAFAEDEEMRGRVGELLTPLATDTRTQIVSQLPSCRDTNFALELLQSWDSETNSEIKTLASVNYNALLHERNENIEPSLQYLNSMLPCYGLDHEARRQAALAGLLTLRRLDLIKGKSETVAYEGQPVVVEVREGLRENRVFVDCIGKHWDYLKENVEGDISKLFHRSDPSYGFWNELASVGANYPIVADHILAEADLQPSLLQSPNVLKMIGRLEPRSERLLNCCLNALSGNLAPYNWFDAAEAASTLLSEHFRKDPLVEQRLLGLIKNDIIPTGVVMALSKGWPENEILRTLESEIESGIRANDALALYPKYATVEASALPSVFASDLALVHEYRYRGDLLLKPVLARLRNDPSVGPHLLRHVSQSANPSVKATFSKCLAFIGGLTQEYSRWCREEIVRQGKLHSPELGLDLFYKSVRSVSTCLIESLGDAVEEQTLTL